MLTESAKVLDTEADGVWVEARQLSQCGSCAARKGCGHSLLHELFGRRVARVFARSDDSSLLGHIRSGDVVTIGIAESTLLRASLLLYLIPLCTLLAATMSASALGGSEGLIILAGLAGLALGFLLLRGQWLRQYLPLSPEIILLGRQADEHQVKPLHIDALKARI